MSEPDLPQDDRREPTAADQELVEAVGNMSDRAIGQPWHPQTSTGALLFLRYGGYWGRLAARDVSSELRHIEGLARQRGSWPLLIARSNGQRVALTSYQQSVNRWRILEQGGLAATTGELTHLIAGGPPSPRTAKELECGEDISGGIPKRVGRVSYDAEWCPSCAESMARDVGPETGWALRRTSQPEPGHAT